MARRATEIKYRRAGAQNILVVDAGNSLISESPSDTEPAARTKGQTSVEILNRMGYDAVALGREDLLLGKEELLKRMAEAKSFTFLSANLQDKATNKLIAQPYVVKEVGGHHVALIGLTGALPDKSTEFSLIPPEVAAREYVRRVQGQADVIILLSNAGVEANQKLADQLQDVDLVISGGGGAPTTDPIKALSGALIVQADQSSAGHAGRVLGEFQGEFDRDGKLTGNTWRSVQLTKEIPDDPAMAEWVKSVTASQ